MKIFKTSKWLFALIFSFILVSCNHDKENLSENINSDIQSEDQSSSVSIESRDRQPIVLGEQKNNPFSVENMMIALDSLRSYVLDTNDSTFSLKSLILL